MTTEPLEALAGAGHPAAIIGVAEPGSGVRDGGGRPLSRPDRDEVARLAE